MNDRNLIAVAIGVAIAIIFILYALPFISSNQQVPVYNQTISGEYGVPIYLGHKPLVANSVRLYNRTYTAVNGTDYTVSLANGTITLLSTGKLLNNTPYSVDYAYKFQYSGEITRVINLMPFLLLFGALIMLWRLYVG